MRKLLLVFIILFNCISGYTQSYLVEGTALLENQTNHSQILIMMERIAPTSLTYFVITDSAGYYYETVEGGIYDITYSKEGYITETTTDVPIYSNTILPDIMLEMEGLSGMLSGVLQPGEYYISGDIEVPVDDTLIIKPGVKLLFGEGVSFISRGTLLSNGTVDDSIIYINKNPGEHWKGLDIKSINVSQLSYIRVQGSSSTGISITGNCHLTNSTICYNEATYGGGGLAVCTGDFSTATLTNCRIHNNLSNKGGGISISYSVDNPNFKERPVISNCIIDNNEAHYGSGLFVSIWFYSGIRIPLIYNCIFTNNQCQDISNGTIQYESGSGPPYIINSIICNNIGYGMVFYSSSSYFGFNNAHNNSTGNFLNPPPYIGNNITTNTNGDSCDAYHNIQMDPMFVYPDTGNYRLMVESPCIDVGLNDSVFVDLDYDGYPRIWDGNGNGDTIVDMGAFEYGASIVGFGTPISNKIHQKIVLYPNPARDHIYIQLKREPGKQMDYRIYDVFGKKIKYGNLNGFNSTKIGIADLTSGLYFITLSSEKSCWNGKLIVR